MRIVIHGCGKIGKSILKSLIRENHEIVVIDTDPTVIQTVTDSFDVMGICASGTDCTALCDADVRSAELFIAATGNDEINMLSSFLAKRLGAKHTVTRISAQEHSDDLEFLKRQLDISMVINPDMLTAQTIENILKFTSAVRCESFTRRRFEMAELLVKPETILDGAVLFELRGKLKANFLVCCVLRDRRAYIPKGDFVLRAGDRIGLLASPGDMQKLLKTIGVMQKRTKQIMILGAGRVAVYLAEELSRSGHSVKLLEKDPVRAAEVCDLLPGSVSVICGDGTRHELLSEEGLGQTDAFVTLTGMDEENILSSYYALGKNVPKIITKVNQAGFTDISEKLGLDCVISPHRITADIVTQYARALHNSLGSSIETLYSLMNGSVEALEFRVSDDFAHANIPLRSLKIKPDILIAGIIRGTEKIIPNGSDVILPRDHVIVFAAGTKLCDLSDIML